MSAIWCGICSSHLSATLVTVLEQFRSPGFQQKYSIRSVFFQPFTGYLEHVIDAYRVCTLQYQPMCKTLALFPNFDLSIAADASPYGGGAVISKQHLNGSEHLIAFPSRTLTSSENYPQIKEYTLTLVNVFISTVPVWSERAIPSLVAACTDGLFCCLPIDTSVSDVLQTMPMSIVRFIFPCRFCPERSFPMKQHVSIFGSLNQPEHSIMVSSRRLYSAILRQDILTPCRWTH